MTNSKEETFKCAADYAKQYLNVTHVNIFRKRDRRPMEEHYLLPNEGEFIIIYNIQKVILAKTITHNELIEQMNNEHISEMNKLKEQYDIAINLLFI